jgi:hypothetical protein
MDKNVKYEIAIAGRRYPTEVRLYTPKTAYTTSDPVSPNIPKILLTKEMLILCSFQI